MEPKIVDWYIIPTNNVASFKSWLNFVSIQFIRIYLKIGHDAKKNWLIKQHLEPKNK